MSTETRNEIAIIPAEVKVIRHVRQVYACADRYSADAQTHVSGEPSFVFYHGACHVPEVCRQPAALSSGAAVCSNGSEALTIDACQLDDLRRRELACAIDRADEGIFIEAGRLTCRRDDAASAPRAGQIRGNAVVFVALPYRSHGSADRAVRLPVNSRW